MIQESIREMLHDYIEHADEKKITAIFTLLESDIKKGSSRYTEAEIAHFISTRDGVLEGKIKGS